MVVIKIVRGNVNNLKLHLMKLSHPAALETSIPKFNLLIVAQSPTYDITQSWYMLHGISPTSV